MAHFTTEQIAGRIFDGCVMTLAFDPDFDTLAAARRINAGEGWTIEESAPLNSITRYEGVQVSDAQLVEAHDLAMAWL